MNTKKKTLSVLTMAATALLFAACDKDEVGGPGDSHISQEVLAAFNARYPGAQDVRWSLRGDYAVANFFFEAARTESRANNAAWFENANGQWAMTETVFPVHVYHRASAVIIEVTLNLLFDTRRRFLWNIVFITIIRSIGYFVHQYAFGRKIQVHPGRYAVCRAGDADNIDNGHTLAATGPDDLLALELIHLTSTGPSFGFGIFAGIETFPTEVRKSSLFAAVTSMNSISMRRGTASMQRSNTDVGILVRPCRKRFTMR